uniref:protein-serine/threonine phosphatase n=1 Tax=Aegilops tauschii subsp. strangulata TaxID=200361 RepID=A0A453SJP8_AEGTS
EQMRIKEVDVGVMAIFDGHNGDEASEMASKLLLEYLLLHVYFLLDGIYSIMFRNSTGKLTHKEVTILNSVLNLYKEDQSNHGQRSCWISPTILDRSFHMEILKESLLRAVQDIDLTFSKEALRKKFKSGSTATVVLIADGQIITANVGDSKAFLCSQSHASYRQKRKRRRKRNSSNHEDFALANYGGPLYNVKELTRDHHPDREDERRRVEAAGGYVLEWAGVYRVNGELALSRAIGDVPFKRYGVISTPELTGWQLLSANDSFLIASSDGVFEKMSMQDVCDMMLYAKYGVNQDFEPLAVVQQNLADFIVHLALQKGTTDNVAAVIVPLGSPSSSGARIEDWHHLEENSVTSVLPLQTIPYQHKSDDGVSSAVIEMEYFKRSSTKFQRFLVSMQNLRDWVVSTYLRVLMKTWTLYLGYPRTISMKESMTSITCQLKMCYLLMEILKNTRTETFAGTLSIKMMKWDDVLVLKGLQIILACLILFHIMEADQAVHMHLAIR